MAIHWSHKVENGQTQWAVCELGRGFYAEIERVGQSYWHWIVALGSTTGQDNHEIIMYGFADTLDKAKDAVCVWDDNRENLLLATLRSLANWLGRKEA